MSNEQKRPYTDDTFLGGLKSYGRAVKDVLTGKLNEKDPPRQIPKEVFDAASSTRDTSKGTDAGPLVKKLWDKQDDE